MIEFLTHTLANGLKVVLHKDPSTPIAALNILYNAGSRVEQPHRTGLAHLFEHLMFSGSENVEDFDDIIQNAGGDSNAFTNSDITNFYDMLPVENLETALWLESDRMASLKLTDEDVDIQRKVVIEEFKETCLDQPYGNLWHHMSNLVYTSHPYRWPTIGLTPEHLLSVTTEELRDHFTTWYRPNNAILVIAGDFDPAEILKRIEYWFGDIPPGPPLHFPLFDEPVQTSRREITERENVPLEALYMGFLCPGRLEPAFYAADLLTDILANGPSSRLYRRLVMEQELFSHIDCYLNGSLDPGVFMIEGKPSPGISLEVAESAIWKELLLLANEGVPEQELLKIKNKNETAIAFSQVSVVHRAMNLAHFAYMGDPGIINQETALYDQISAQQIQELATTMFHPDRVNVVFYRK